MIMQFIITTNENIQIENNNNSPFIIKKKRLRYMRYIYI